MVSCTIPLVSFTTGLCLRPVACLFRTGLDLGALAVFPLPRRINNRSDRSVVGLAPYVGRLVDQSLRRRRRRAVRLTCSEVGLVLLGSFDELRQGAKVLSSNHHPILWQDILVDQLKFFLG